MSSDYVGRVTSTVRVVRIIISRVEQRMCSIEEARVRMVIEKRLLYRRSRDDDGNILV